MNAYDVAVVVGSNSRQSIIDEPPMYNCDLEPDHSVTASGPAFAQRGPFSRHMLMAVLRECHTEQVHPQGQR